MWSYFTIALGLAVLATTTAQQNGGTGGQQPPQSQCVTNFRNGFFGCITKFNLDTQEFMGLINNQSRAGTPIGTDPFKDKACPLEQDFFKCGTDFMTQLKESKVCDANPQTDTADEYKPVLMQFFSLMGQFDFICAHPCRKDLLMNLRKCYDEAELDADLFLSNSTAGRGAVIGTNQKEASQYCLHKDKLVSCMKDKRDNCPDAPEVLRNINLDIEAMEKGVGILCKHQEVYLKGLECFAETTKGVEACAETQRQEMVALVYKASNTSLDEDAYYKDFCKIRAKHVGCDLSKWAEKDHPMCNDAVIGLRTEMECGLMPDICQKLEKTTLDKVCHVDGFKRDERNNNGGSGGGGGAEALSVSIALTSVFAVLSHLYTSSF